jgi:hypothetical protein
MGVHCWDTLYKMNYIFEVGRWVDLVNLLILLTNSLNLLRGSIPRVNLRLDIYPLKFSLWLSILYPSWNLGYGLANRLWSGYRVFLVPTTLPFT